MNATRPKVEEVPGPGSCCGRTTCRNCDKVTGCREDFEKPLRAKRNGD